MIELTRSERRITAWMAPPAWLAIAALACVAGLLFWKPLTPAPHAGPVNQPLTLNHPALEDAGELAVLWVSTADFLAATELVGSDEPQTALSDDELLESFVEPTVASEADLDRLRAPSWMMAALADPSAVEGQE